VQSSRGKTPAKKGSRVTGLTRRSNAQKLREHAVPSGGINVADHIDQAARATDDITGCSQIIGNTDETEDLNRLFSISSNPDLRETYPVMESFESRIGVKEPTLESKQSSWEKPGKY